MKAVVYQEFRQQPYLQQVADPIPTKTGVVLKVEATGICRSDWHGWMGNDSDVKLPHVPGHELAGVVVEAGSNVKNWKIGDRVTLPFVGGCGSCGQCASGNQQVCDFQFQPGFTHWGSFAEYVAIEYADTNLVQLPDEIDFVTASSLGCRFITSFRAVVEQGKVKGGEWVAVHGCGGVGLSAIMIANALGANVVAIDIADDKLDFARTIGAVATVNSKNVDDTIEAVKEITKGGANVSLDALGNPVTCFNSIANLRKRGKHIQVGIMEAEYRNTSIPMGLVIANELEIIGSHGMQAYKYPEMLEMIRQGKLKPEKLIGKTISLEESIEELVNMNSFNGTGVMVIDRF
ncbi:MAG TPA: zinc-dependent alcohol dehydrogenase family protein [Pyrinomonadaceae bacterium]|nr:zinc-dependent alcohol dehydrogenase family protein [Pyrinomonadaceae bacterium]